MPGIARTTERPLRCGWPCLQASRGSIGFFPDFRESDLCVPLAFSPALNPRLSCLSFNALHKPATIAKSLAVGFDAGAVPIGFVRRIRSQPFQVGTRQTQRQRPAADCPDKIGLVAATAFEVD